ncbi:MAG: elongation factor P [Patescibacteria group bacterium]|nr:elongation factor P [Patescibacteria group bacterium]
MLEYNEITLRKYIVLDGEPYEVIGSHVFRKQMRKPVNQTKLRSLISGKVTERSFGQSEKADEADIDTRSIKYLYSNRGEFWFCEENDPKARFTLPSETVGNSLKFVKVNTPIEALVFHTDDTERIIGIKPPVKVELKVTEAPPSIKGDTAQGGNKQVTLETGASVNTPLFINTGDIIRINTDTEAYVERVEKAAS